MPLGELCEAVLRTAKRDDKDTSEESLLSLLCRVTTRRDDHFVCSRKQSRVICKVKLNNNERRTTNKETNNDQAIEKKKENEMQVRIPRQTKSHSICHQSCASH